MAVAEKPMGASPLGSRIQGTERAQVELFAVVFEAYQKATPTVKDIVETMTHVINDSDATREELDAAVDTLVEALFPGRKDKSYGADLAVFEAADDEDVRDIQEAYVRQEEKFSAAVRRIMSEKGMTQRQLADKVGISQPAVALLLGRKCRPQQSTIAKIAEALGVEPDVIWPGS